MSIRVYSWIASTLAVHAELVEQEFVEIHVRCDLEVCEQRRQEVVLASGRSYRIR